MLRFGVVVGVDEARGMVRVQYTDMDGEVSYWLAVLKPKTLKDKAYWMPDIGEHVAVLIDENAEEGVVLGAIYSSADSVPVANRDKCHIKFEDGTWIEYDRAQHKLKAFVNGNVEITATGGCIIEGPVHIIGNLEVAGNIHATGAIIDEGGNTNHHSH